MLLLLLTAIFLFFNTWFIGTLLEQGLQKWFRIQLLPNAVEVFLLGLIASFLYFNLVSFFYPVNYQTLLPLLVVALAGCWRKRYRVQLQHHITETMLLFFHRKNVALLIPFILLFVGHALLPPANWDSSGYHYDSIKWYEQYRVVPGLANVHARLAYNPANFIISAAYSFTGLVKQAIYPLNGVLATLFYCWIIKRTLSDNNWLHRLVWLAVAILLFRVTLVNIACPSADLLSVLLLFYTGIRLFENIVSGKQRAGDYQMLFLLLVFAVTAKLSAVPALIIIPFLFLFIIKKEKSISLVMKSVLLAIGLWLPWMCRNLVMTGYLLYPILGTNPIHFDWAVPPDVIQLDYVYSKFGPRTVSESLDTLQQMNTAELFGNWLYYLQHYYVPGLVQVLAAIAAPALWLLFPLAGKKIPFPVWGLWLIYYGCFWIWVINAPEFRFGLAYIVLTIVLPLLAFSRTQAVKQPIAAWWLSLPLYFCCWHYALAAIRKDSFYPFTLADCWLKPLRSYRYFINNDTASFPYVWLKNGVKLYMSDRQHECLNVDGPCMIWRYGTIEMRGNTIQEGFRNIKDEVQKNYPFIRP